MYLLLTMSYFILPTRLCPASKFRCAYGVCDLLFKKEMPLREDYGYVKVLGTFSSKLPVSLLKHFILEYLEKSLSE